jgi:hypothetical protein
MVKRPRRRSVRQQAQRKRLEFFPTFTSAKRADG